MRPFGAPLNNDGGTTGQMPERDRETLEAVYAWLRLVRVFQKIQHATAGALRCRDLSPAQFDVLAQVGTHEGVVQQRLAESLMVTKGNVCQLLDRMEESGLVERQSEGRANKIVLTEAGQDIFREVVPEQEELIAAQFATLSPAERSQLLSLLRKLDQALPRQVSEDTPRRARRTSAPRPGQSSRRELPSADGSG